jgi:hypothetical protein
LNGRVLELTWLYTERHVELDLTRSEDGSEGLYIKFWHAQAQVSIVVDDKFYALEVWERAVDVSGANTLADSQYNVVQIVPCPYVQRMAEHDDKALE